MIKSIKVLHPGVASDDSIAYDNPEYMLIEVEVEYHGSVGNYGLVKFDKKFQVMLDHQALRGDGAYWFDPILDPNRTDNDGYGRTWKQIAKTEAKKYNDRKKLSKKKRERLK